MIDGYYAYYTSEDEEDQLHGKGATAKKYERHPSSAQDVDCVSANKIFSQWVFPAMKKELMKSCIVGSLSPVEECKDDVEIIRSWRRFKKALNSFEKLKQITRQDVPAHLRARLWQEVTGGTNLMSKTPELYQDICNKLFGTGVVIPEELPQCSLTSDNDFVPYYLNPDGVILVRKVLCVLSYLHPDVTCCPLLEPLAAIFLHFMEEVWCFACLSAMLTSSERRLLDQTNIEVAVAAATFEECARSAMRHVLKRLKSMIISDSEKQKGIMFPRWQRMIFDNLDFTILVRVVDCFIVEGSKVLYRVGLSLLEAFYEYSKNFKSIGCPTAHELENAISHHATCLQMTGNEMIKVSLKVRLVTKEIQEAHKRNMRLVKAGEIDVHAEESSSTSQFTVNVNKLSDIITLSQWRQLYSWLPMQKQLLQAVLAFSTEADGYNLKTLYNKVEDEDSTVLILKTNKNEVFGAYLSGALCDRHGRRGGLSYFGDGRTFLFRLHPKAERFAWVGLMTSPQKKKRGKSSTGSGNYIFVDYKPVPEKSAKRRRSSLRRLGNMALRRSSVAKYKVDPDCTMRHSASARTFRDHVTELPEGVPRNFSYADVTTPAVSYSADEGIQIREIVQTERHLSTSNDSIPRNADIAEEQDESRDTIEADSDLFIACDHTCLIVGGGGGGQGLWVDGALERGRTHRCSTFNNVPLTESPAGDFQCVRLEVYRFEEPEI